MVSVSIYIIPALVLLTLFLSIIQKKNCYNKFTDGAKEGLNLFIEIFPTFMAMLTAVELLRACGFMDDIAGVLVKYIPNIKFFAELTPLMFFRPLSGGASLSIMTSICSSNGPDSLVCKTASSIQGTTDTTFYILSLYFTSIGVTKWRHSIKAGLISDITGMFMAILLSLIFL